jgi:hypothetical protein
MSAASDDRSACKPCCASTVWPGRRYRRANGKWTERDQEVKFWCLGSQPAGLQGGAAGGRLLRLAAMQTFSPGYPCPDTRPLTSAFSSAFGADQDGGRVGRSSGGRQASCGGGGPAGGPARSVFSYMTSSGRLFVPSLFIFCLPTLHINGRGLPGSGRTARRSKTGESNVVVECRKGANAFRRKSRWSRDHGPSVTLSVAQIAEIKG